MIFHRFAIFILALCVSVAAPDLAPAHAAPLKPAPTRLPGMASPENPPHPMETSFGNLSGLRRHLGSGDALLIMGPDDRVLVAVNAHRPMVPASTLKIFTALVAMATLGPDYRFPTELFLDEARNLVVKGYGDPLLTSESLSEMAAEAARHLLPQNPTPSDLVVDDTYFTRSAVPGVSPSLEPFDAPNGAFCANFNTVYFRTEKGRRISAEPQTPLIDFARRLIPSGAPPQGRITLSHDADAIALYAGHLLTHFLSDQGIHINGRVRVNVAAPGLSRLVLTHLSPWPLTGVISKMLEFSNNFIANQLLIAAGAAACGPPGNLDKGVRVACEFARNHLAMNDLTLVEGSGISRKNRIRAWDMGRVLKAFLPHRDLLRRRGPESYKTGTLNGIHTRAGYVDTPDGSCLRYVVLTTGRKNSVRPLMRDFLHRVGVDGRDLRDWRKWP